jgi:hypothetical protein
MNGHGSSLIQFPCSVSPALVCDGAGGGDRMYDAPSRALVLEISERVKRWRFLTGERRAELTLLLLDLLTEIERLEASDG